MVLHPESTSAIHDRYILSLLESLSLLDRNSDSCVSHVRLSYRLKLQRVLLESSQYDAEKLHQIIPSYLVEEKALILGALGEHSKVLDIYVFELKSIEHAEKYCDRIYNTANDHSTKRDIYITLLEVIMASNNGIDSVHLAVQLAQRHANKIEVTQFLRLLSPELPMTATRKFFAVMSEKESHKRKLLKVAIIT